MSVDAPVKGKTGLALVAALATVLIAAGLHFAQSDSTPEPGVEATAHPTGGARIQASASPAGTISFHGAWDPADSSITIEYTIHGQALPKPPNHPSSPWSSQQFPYDGHSRAEVKITRNSIGIVRSWIVVNGQEKNRFTAGPWKFAFAVSTSPS